MDVLCAFAAGDTDQDLWLWSEQYGTLLDHTHIHAPSTHSS